MRRYRGLFRLSGAFSYHQFSADYTINMFEFDFRQGKESRQADKFSRSGLVSPPLPSRVKLMRAQAVALRVRLSGELLATLSSMAAWGPPLVVPMEYTGGTAMTVRTASRAGRATNRVAEMGSAMGLIDTE
jgi:hypothetical protein